MVPSKCRKRCGATSGRMRSEVTSDARRDPLIGTRLSERYEIVGELGRGGMGVVYRARDPLLNREVAIKFISSADLAPDIEGRFQREAQIVAQMDHPAIVPIHD